MVKTGKTSKKRGNRCPMCAGRFEESDWANHLIECGNRTMSLKRFECPDCDYATVKKSDLDRHQRRLDHRPRKGQQTSDSEEGEEEDEWEEQDPSHLLGPPVVKEEPDWSVNLNQENDVSNDGAMEGSSVTEPCPPIEAQCGIVDQTPTVGRKRSSSLTGISTRPKISKPNPDLDLDETTDHSTKQDHYVITGVRTIVPGRIFVNVGTQTDAPIKNVTKKKTVTYQKKGKTITEITEEHWTEY